ncbi:MAG: DUF4368 domain-containing protein [Eubacteriales bacterium]|nr:DUF4368 domain-containing protein [Eubacteriales bacterium]
MATERKYKDLQELDATVLLNFIERIELSHAERGEKIRNINLVYIFIGAFAFTGLLKSPKSH